MKVEFLIGGVRLDDDVAIHAGQLIESVMQAMGAPEECVRGVTLADQEHFGEAVRRCDPSETYTNGNGLCSAGKTIAHLGDGRAGPSSVVLLAELFSRALCAARQKGPDVSKWTDDEAVALFIVFHELGHCLDNYVRPPLRDDAARDIGTMTGRIDALTRSQFGVLLGELAASLHAARGTRAGVRAHESDSDNGVLLDLLGRLHNMTNEEEPDERRVLLEVLGAVWFVLIQHSKQLGVAIIVDGDNATVTGHWKCAQAHAPVSAALRDAECVMRGLVQRYPNWNIAMKSELQTSALALARSFGYEIDMDPGAESVRWDWRTQGVAIAAASRSRHEE